MSGMIGKAMLLALLTGLGISGCASIMHGTTQEITFETSPSGAVVTAQSTKGDEQISNTTPCSMKLKRKREYNISFHKPGYQPAAHFLEQKTSNWTYGNLFFWSLPGFIVDFSNGATYRLDPQQIAVALTVSPDSDTSVAGDMIPIVVPDYISFPEQTTLSDPGKLRLAITIPEGNWFYYNYRERLVNNFGFMGLVIGLEYAPAQNYYYSARLGVATTFLVPFPAPVDYCVYTGCDEVQLQFQIHHNVSRYSFGGGLHWLYINSIQNITNPWFCEKDLSDVREYDLYCHSFGLSLSAQRRFANHWYVDLNYLPTVLLREKGRYRWAYSHTVYLGLTYKTTLMGF